MKQFIIDTEKRDLLVSKIQEHLKKPGPLMPILHEAQHIFGCIPVPVQKLVAEYVEETVAEINGVVTFYSSFTLEPTGKYIVGVCLGTPCYVRGAQIILDSVKEELGIKERETTADGQFTLEAIRCIGTCGMAPVMSIGDEVVGEMNVTKAKKMIKDWRNK